MALLTMAERRGADAIAAIGYCNPFLPKRLDLERAVLGTQFVGDRPVVAYQPERSLEDMFPNAPVLRATTKALTDKMRAGLLRGESAAESDLVLYQDLVLNRLYNRYTSPLDGLIRLGRDVSEDHNNCFVSGTIEFWDQFLHDDRHYLSLPGWTLPVRYEPAHTLACFFQIQRAFHLIFAHLVGESEAITGLRAAVWQSIFTRDMSRYARATYRNMHDFPTLITGPSGTGKELIARAIGQARYVPFDATAKTFRPESSRGKTQKGASDAFFHPGNVAALSPMLIDSELFGHRKGAFTGAIENRVGRLECPHEHETVFLDEVGELPAELQVKLLRVLQSRKFDRVGESGEKQEFQGKIIAATNRDLAEEVQAGRFRKDFYYRLCADTIAAPSLREQLADHGQRRRQPLVPPAPADQPLRQRDPPGPDRLVLEEPLQVLAQFVRGLVAPPGVLVDRLEDNRLQVARNPRIERPRRRRFRVGDQFDQSQPVRRSKCRPQDKQFYSVSPSE